MLQAFLLCSCARSRSTDLQFAAPAQSLASVLALRNQTGQDLFAIPHTEAVDWSQAAVGEPPVRLEGRPLITISQTSEGSVVFVARPDANGRVVIEPFYARIGLNELLQKKSPVIVPPLAAIPRCSNSLWIAAFFIDGVGTKPTANATVHLTDTNGVYYSLRVNAERNIIRAKPALEFHTSDVHGFDGTPKDGLSGNVTEGSIQRSAIYLVLNNSATGWHGAGATAGERFYAYYNSIGIAPRDAWRVYALVDPTTCRTPSAK